MYVIHISYSVSYTCVEKKQWKLIYIMINIIIVGVDVQADSSIKSIKTDENNKVVLDIGNDKQVVADHVVVAVGIEPRVDLARDAGLEVDEKRAGVVVNAELEARTDVFAAGDMVSFHDVQLGRRRIEHHDQYVVPPFIYMIMIMIF